MNEDIILHLEKLIGKPVEEATNLGNLIKTPIDNYKFEPEIIEELFEVPCGSLQINTDEDDLIETIAISFSVIITRHFYEEMIGIYELPCHIFAQNKLISESKSMTIGEELFKQEVSKRMFSMKEVDFKDKPIFIIWNKDQFQIKMMFNYEYNVTQLIFRKPTDRF